VAITHGMRLAIHPALVHAADHRSLTGSVILKLVAAWRRAR